MKNIAEVIKQNDVVRVKVMSVDATQGRIALSMKGMRRSSARDAGKGSSSIRTSTLSTLRFMRTVCMVR